MVGIGETYFAAFALALGTGETFAGLVATLPMLAGAALQLATPWCLQRARSYKKWVILCASLQAAASAPDHPAHAFFAERQRSVHAVVAADIRARQDAGEMPAGVDADTAATVLLALSDGLQLQQGVDPSIDIAEILAWTWERLSRAD